MFPLFNIKRNFNSAPNKGETTVIRRLTKCGAAAGFFGFSNQFFFANRIFFIKFRYKTALDFFGKQERILGIRLKHIVMVWNINSRTDFLCGDKRLVHIHISKPTIVISYALQQSCPGFQFLSTVVSEKLCPPKSLFSISNPFTEDIYIALFLTSLNTLFLTVILL